MLEFSADKLALVKFLCAVKSRITRKHIGKSYCKGEIGETLGAVKLDAEDYCGQWAVCYAAEYGNKSESRSE